MQKRRLLPIAPNVYNYVLLSSLATVIFFLGEFWVLFALSFIAFIFILFFFRDPKRIAPAGENLIVCPADGKVSCIEEVYEDEFFKSKAIRIVIVLSIFNVHINRSPISGVVKYKKYKHGTFIPVFKSHFCESNERNSLGIENSNGTKVLVNQITGFLARRIVCCAKTNSDLDLGERYGMIKFGSCVELFVPTNVDLKVAVGDKVKALSSIIGVINWKITKKLYQIF